MMNGFALCLVYEQAGARPLVLAKLSDPTLLQQAARTAVLDAETRARGLRETDLKDFAEEEATRLRQVLALLTEPQAKAGAPYMTQ